MANPEYAEFARRLHEKMRGEKLRVWFAPEDMQGGQELIEQIDRAIQVNDRLLLVLSEQSMNSTWVRREIQRARATERGAGVGCVNFRNCRWQRGKW